MAGIKTNEITIGTMELFDKMTSAYGKSNSVTNVLVDTSARTADFLTAVPATANPALKAGDIVVGLGNLTLTAVAGQTITLSITYFKNGIGYVTTATTASISTDVTPATFKTAIDNALALVLPSYTTYLTTTAGTGVVVIESLDTKTFVTVESVGTGVGVVAGDVSKVVIAKLNSDTTDGSDESVTVLYASASIGAIAFTFVAYRNLAEMTGVTINSSLTPVEYKGNSKYTKQIEYGEGDATITADETAFNIKNLEYLYGMTAGSGTFTSGATITASGNAGVYRMSETTVPPDVALFGIHKKSNGNGVIIFEADKAKTNNLDLSMKKLDYRLNSVEFTLMTPSTSKAVWTLTNME